MVTLIVPCYKGEKLILRCRRRINKIGNKNPNRKALAVTTEIVQNKIGNCPQLLYVWV